MHEGAPMGHHRCPFPQCVIRAWYELPTARCAAYIWMVRTPNTYPRSGYLQRFEQLLQQYAQAVFLVRGMMLDSPTSRIAFLSAPCSLYLFELNSPL